MRRWIGVLGATVAVAALSAAAAMAENNCCWDWGVAGVPGAYDEWSDPKKPPSSPDGWAQCIPVPKEDCFKRQNRQMYWRNWKCDVVPGPDPAPDGTLPGPGNSFYCVRKGFIDRVVLVNNSTPPVTQPPGVVPSGDIADEPAPTPGASPLGLGVVGAIMLLSGAWIIYRKRASATA